MLTKTDTAVNDEVINEYLGGKVIPFTIVLLANISTKISYVCII